MKQLIIVVCILFQGTVLLAQKEKKYVHNGNKLYEQKKYAAAEAKYRESVEQSKQSVEGNFNLGDALYKQQKFEPAMQKFTEIAASTNNKAIKAKAYHNLGNSLLQSKKLEESIEAYKKSLLNNPKDEETRYNLAYAQEKLKQQQQQNKDKEDEKSKDQGGKDKEDEKNKDQGGKDKKDEKSKDQGDKDKEDKDQGKPKPDQLSKEDAERMLEALNNEEKNTQDKLKNKKAGGVKAPIKKNW